MNKNEIIQRLYIESDRITHDIYDKIQYFIISFDIDITDDIKNNIVSIVFNKEKLFLLLDISFDDFLELLPYMSYPYTIFKLLSAGIEKSSANLEKCKTYLLSKKFGI